MPKFRIRALRWLAGAACVAAFPLAASSAGIAPLPNGAAATQGGVTTTATPALDANLYGKYYLQGARLAVQVCGSTASRTGCFGKATFGPFGHACSVIEGAAVQNDAASTVTRQVLILDNAPGGGTGLSVSIWNRVDTISATDDVVTATLVKTIPVSLPGGKTTKCFMAQEPGTLYVGTNVSYQFARVSKTNYATDLRGGFSPGIPLSSLNADVYGWLTGTFGGSDRASQGFYLFPPTKNASFSEDGGGSYFTLGTQQGANVAVYSPMPAHAMAPAVRRKPNEAHAASIAQNAAAGVPIDHALSTTYWMINDTIDSFVCGDVELAYGCFSQVQIMPVGHVCSMMEGNRTINANIGWVTRHIYVLENAATGSKAVTFSDWRKVDVIGRDTVSSTLTLVKRFTVPLTGGATTACYMAANANYIYVGTNASTSPVWIRKSDLAFGTGGGFTPALPVSMISASANGFVTVSYGTKQTAGSGFYLWGPNGELMENTGPATFLVDSQEGVDPTNQAVVPAGTAGSAPVPTMVARIRH